MNFISQLRRLGKTVPIMQVCKKTHKGEEQESQEALPKGKSLLAPPSPETPKVVSPKVEPEGAKKPEEPLLKCTRGRKESVMKPGDLLKLLSTGLFSKQLFASFPRQQEQSCSLCVVEKREKVYTMTR